MPLRVLFLDLNSYFASVEQQMRPELRGRPIAVGPVEHESGTCIAASYEAKAFGVTTGTKVGEAKRLCPGITLVRGRPRLYVQVHHRILEAIDRCIPVQAVHSIDEVSCRLAPAERAPEAAAELARRIKRTIARDVGVCLRCSIGIAPNRILAKVGTDMQKPDGLVILRSEELPQRLHALRLTDFPGIGPRMNDRLLRAGIGSVEDLCRRSEAELEAAWGGVVGRRWWQWLRGEETHERPTRRRSIGHQHVLPPEFRSDPGARGVAVRLLHKAAARLRHLDLAATRLTLAVRCKGDDEASRGSVGGAWGWASWHATASLGAGCQDTPTMVESLDRLWASRPSRDGRPPVFVGVTLHELVAPPSRTLPLFEDEEKRARLSHVLDTINDRYGANAVYMSGMHEARTTGSGGIAFNYVPSLELADTVIDPEGMSDEQLLEAITRSRGPADDPD